MAVKQFFVGSDVFVALDALPNDGFWTRSTAKTDSGGVDIEQFSNRLHIAHGVSFQFFDAPEQLAQAVNRVALRNQVA